MLPKSQPERVFYLVGKAAVPARRGRYATDTLGSCRVAGTYVGRILKGEKPGAAFSASSRLFDLNGEMDRVRKRQKSAIIAVDVRRFLGAAPFPGVLSYWVSETGLAG